MLNKTINGYTIKRKLGEGGMAEVWYAENSIGKTAAIKFLKAKFCTDETVVERFQNEAKVMVKLAHPHIRQVYDYAFLDSQPCIVMEYLEGNDLKTRLKNGERFGDRCLRNWWDQLVDALNYTHQQGVIHRDIKPSNIFTDKDDNVRLMDFGIAKIEESSGHTQTGVAMGTRIYMSPEQVRDPKRVKAATDAYSLAVTFVHLITGETPYDTTTNSDFDIQMAIVQQPLDLSKLPNDWRNFLQPYLEKNPEKRPKLRAFDIVEPTVSQMPNKSDGDETIMDSSKATLNDFGSSSDSSQDNITEMDNALIQNNGQINAESKDTLSQEPSKGKSSSSNFSVKNKKSHIIYIALLVILGIVTIAIASSKQSRINKLYRERSELSNKIDNLRDKKNNLEYENRQLKDKNSSLSKILEKVSKNNPIIVSSVEVTNGNQEYGSTIYSRNTTYLYPRIKGFSLIGGNIKVQIKVYSPHGLLRENFSPNGYTYQWDMQLNKNESFIVELGGWGNNQKGNYYSAGKYRFEIWHQGKCLGSTSFTIH